MSHVTREQVKDEYADLLTSLIPYTECTPPELASMQVLDQLRHFRALAAVRLAKGTKLYREMVGAPS